MVINRWLSNIEFFSDGCDSNGGLAAGVHHFNGSIENARTRIFTNCHISRVTHNADCRVTPLLTVAMFVNWFRSVERFTQISDALLRFEMLHPNVQGSLGLDPFQQPLAP